MNNPKSADKKNWLAYFSSFFSNVLFSVRIETKESKQENIKRIAITAVNSSTILASEKLAIWKEVITKRQKPSKFVLELRIYWDVLLDIKLFMLLLKELEGAFYNLFQFVLTSARPCDK